MSNAPNLTLISEVLPVQRRDFSLFDPTILNPTAVNPLLDGEWLEIDTNYLAKRGSGEGTKLAFQVFSLKGQYDTQAHRQDDAALHRRVRGRDHAGDRRRSHRRRQPGRLRRHRRRPEQARPHQGGGRRRAPRPRHRDPNHRDDKVRYWHQGVPSLHI
jgi:hypothetical protein